MLTSKKLLIAAIYCAVAGNGSVMYSMNNNADNDNSMKRKLAGDQPSPIGRVYPAVPAEALREDRESYQGGGAGQGDDHDGHQSKKQRTDVVEPTQQSSSCSSSSSSSSSSSQSCSEEEWRRISHKRKRLKEKWFEAISSGDTEKVQECINDPDLNERVSSNGWTWTNYVDLNARYLNGWTALMIASSKGYTDIVQELLDRGANVDLKDGFDTTALMIAARKGYTDIVQGLLWANANVDLQNKNGETALMRILMPPTKKHIDIIKELLRAGAGVNATDSDGNTILHRVILYLDKTSNQSGSKLALVYHLIIELLNHGADPLIENKARETPRDLASNLANKVIKKHVITWIKNSLAEKRSILRSYMIGDATNIIGEYSANPINQESVISAVLSGNIRKVNALIAADADVDARYYDGLTVLMIAVVRGFSHIVDALLEGKANVNLRTTCGMTALMCAAVRGNLAIVDALIKKMADVNLLADYGTTALMYAARYGHKDIVQKLIENGANVNLKEDNGHTALMYARENGHTNIVQVLLENGADCEGWEPCQREELASSSSSSSSSPLVADTNGNTQDKYGFTALMIAVSQPPQTATIQKILNQPDINVNLKNIYGATALIVAAQLGRTAMVEELLNKPDINVNARDCNGHTAADIAALRGYTQIVNLIQLHKDNKLEARELRRAIESDDVSKIQRLIATGAGIGVADRYIEVALMYAVALRKWNIAEELITQTTDASPFDTRDHSASGGTVLHDLVNYFRHGAIGGITEDDKKMINILIGMLIEKGASLAIKDRNGDTPIDIAMRLGLLEQIPAIQAYKKAIDDELLKNHQMIPDLCNIVGTYLGV